MAKYLCGWSVPRGVTHSENTRDADTIEEAKLALIHEIEWQADSYQKHGNEDQANQLTLFAEEINLWIDGIDEHKSLGPDGYEYWVRLASE